MHWSDEIAKKIVNSKQFTPYWVDDMKTPSGFAHVGSMLGPVIHSCVYRSLKKLGKEVTLTYVFNDFDPADEFPPEFKEKLKDHAGKPLKMVPSPDDNFDNLADLLSNDLKKSIEYLGFEAKYLSSWEMYKEGKFDEVIKLALDNSDKIQDIYQKISGSNKKESGWLPFQVICEKCGKVGTTKVYKWDGEKVSYKCEPNLVTWAKGCGYGGKISPFGGTGKLPWKVDWAAHWKVIGVTIESAGKDHGSKGGSFDIANALVEKVFKNKRLYKFVYEFILIGGKKMSSSKGIGLKAHDLVKILPAPVARFLFVSNNIFTQSNFDPYGTMAIPDLFDSYDNSWNEYNKSGEESISRNFILSQIKDKEPLKLKNLFIPRFRDVANYLSQGLKDNDICKKFDELKKENLNNFEKSLLEERIKYAKYWLKNYAPDEYKFEITDKIPEEALKITKIQKEYLLGILEIYKKDETAEDLQILLYELSKKLNILAKDAFYAIYISLIGKSHGPRAGLLLVDLGREKVIKRLKEVIGSCN